MKKVFGWHNQNMRDASKQQALAYFYVRMYFIEKQNKKKKEKDMAKLVLQTL